MTRALENFTYNVTFQDSVNLYVEGDYHGLSPELLESRERTRKTACQGTRGEKEGVEKVRRQA